MLNNFNCTGRLGADVELSTNKSSGKKYASFSVAITRNYKEGDEYKTDWMDCIAWGNTAEFIEKHGKCGRMLALTGELKSDTYYSKKYKHDILAWQLQVRSVCFLDKKVKEDEEEEVGDRG